MTRVFVNGVYMAQDHDYTGKSIKNLSFKFKIKPIDVIIIERTFLGLTWTRKYYRLPTPNEVSWQEL